MSTDTKVTLAQEMVAAYRRDPTLLRRLVAQYLRIREKHNELTRQRDEVSKQLLPVLEAAGGSFLAKRQGVRVYMDVSERYEYDPKRLRRLVDDELLTEEDFARALRTVVVKAEVEAWVKRGLVTETEIARTGGQVVNKVIRQIKVEVLDRRKAGK